MAGIQVLLDLKNKLTGQMGDAINKLRGQQAQMQGIADKMGMSQVKALKAAQSEIPGLSRGLDILTNKYTLLAAGAVAVGGAIYKATTMAVDWDAAMAKLNVTANLKPAELKSLGNEFLELGKRIPVELDNIPRAFERLISSGMDTNLAKQALEPVLKAAKANKTEVDIVASAMANVMASSGNNNAKEVMDILQATQIKGNAEFSDIASYLPRIIPVARAAGISLKDTAAQFAFLTAKGMKTEQVATALENVGLAMTDNKIKENFKNFGIKLYDKGKLKPMVDIIDEIKQKTAGLSEEAKNAKLDKLGLNQQAGLAIKNMINDTKQLKTITTEMQNPLGALDQAYANAKEKLDPLKIIWNHIKIAMIQAGTAVLDFINPPLQWLQSNLPQIELFLEGTAKAVGIFAAGWLLVNSAILLTSGTTAIFNAIAAMNPFAWIGIVIVSVGLLYAKFEGFRVVIDSIWAVAKQFFADFIGGIKQIVSGIVGIFSGLANIIGGALSLDWKQVKAGAKEMGNGFTDAVKGTVKTALPGVNVITNFSKYKNAAVTGYEDSIAKSKEAKEKQTTETNAAKNPGGLQSDPNNSNNSNNSKINSNITNTDDVAKTGGSAKTIIINIDKLATISLTNTLLEKGMTNKDVEQTLTETLIKSLRNIETSYN